MTHPRHFRLSPPSLALALALALGGAVFAPARLSAADREWRPARLTILLGHAMDGLEGRILQALARSWRRYLGAPVVIAARGRGSLLMTAGEFTLKPRDGSIVLAGDIGSLALAYARERPAWNWGRSFEHLGVFASDPTVVFVAADAGIDDFSGIVDAARKRPFRVGIGHWLSLENLLLQDIAAQTGLKFTPVPAGSGESLLDAVMGGKLRAAFGRLSDITPRRRRVKVLAAGHVLGPARSGIYRNIDAALGMATAPTGRLDVITVHAGFQRDFPDRFERLQRSFRAAVNDEEYRDALAALGFATKSTLGTDHRQLMGVVRRWWDVYRRVGAKLAAPPAPVVTRGKITSIDEGGHVLRYLGLDGKQHDLRVDADETAIVVGGVAITGPEPLKALHIGLICEIARPAAIAIEASRLSCK